MIGIIGTIPYVYPELPDVDTMIIFNNLTIPYSFKFLIGKDYRMQRPYYKNLLALSTENEKLGSW